MTEKAILFDSTRCTACRGCQVACKQWNQLKGETTTCEGTYEIKQGGYDYGERFMRVWVDETSPSRK